MTRLYPTKAAALDRGLERALDLPTIPELGLPTPGKMQELTLGVQHGGFSSRQCWTQQSLEQKIEI